MFVNQVDGNGNFKVTNVTSDNVTATTGTFTNLLTTTFSPTNVNASAVVATNVVSTTGTIDTLNTTTLNTSGVATSGSIQTGNITTADITSNHINATGNIDVTGTIESTGIIKTHSQLAMKSNNPASADATLMKLGDELRINSGGDGSTTGFYEGSTKNMSIQANGEVLVGGEFTAGEVETQMLHINEVARIYNSTGKYSSLEKINADLNIYASKNNPTAPSNVKFFSANGLSNDLKMTIHGTTDVVEVETLQAKVAVKTDELLLKDTTSVNLSRIIREQNTISFIGDTLYNSCDYEFYTADPAHTGATYPKLKINRTSDLVEIPELESTHITGTTIDATDVITTNVSALNTTAINSTVTNLLLRNSTNDYSAIERTGNIVKFFGETSSTGSADFEFHTTDGNQAGQNVPKLRILRNTDTVEVINSNAVDTVEATTLIGDQVSGTDGDFDNITTDDITVNQELDFGANDSKIWASNASFLFQSGAPLTGKDFKFATGNIPAEIVYFRAGRGKGFIETDEGQFTDLTAKGNLYVENSTGKRFAIDHIADNVNIYGAKNNNSQPSNINFMTNAGANPSDIKLKINKSTNFVDVIDMNVSNELIVNGTNIETELATKQDTLTAGTGITIVGNTISSTGGGGVYTGAGNINITNNVINTHPFVSFTDVTVNNELDFGTNYGKIWSSSNSFLFQSGDTGVTGKDFKFQTGLPNEVVYLKTGHGRGYIETDDLEVKNISYLKDSTNSHDLMDYYSSGTNQFLKRSAVFDDYDMFDMLTFNNDATPANRSISVDCDMNVAGDLVVNGTNIETQLSSKQDTLSAGAGITIDANNEISYSGATPVTYTQGANIIINAQDEIETVIDPDFDQVDAGGTSIGGSANEAVFHNKALSGYANWALLQYNTGVTILNASAGRALSFRQGQVQKAKIDPAGDFHIMRVGTLSNLPTELDQIQGDLVGKQTLLTAGANITLDSLGNISSTDTTYTAGTNITIDANNVISSSGGGGGGSSNQLSRTSYYTGGANTVPNGILNYYYNVSTAVINNLNIPFTTQAGNATSGWFLEEGTYKIEYKCNFDNGSFGNRLGIRTLIQFNNVDYLPSECYGYARDQNFIDKQTVSTEIIYTVPLDGQYMAIKHNCSQNSSNYNTVFPSTSVKVPGGVSLIITKLDQVDGIANVNVTKPMFHVTNQTNGNVTYGGGAQTILPFNDQAPAGCFEVGNGYNYSTYKYTIPKSGIWRFNVHLFINTTTADTNARVGIYKNGNTLAFGGNRAGYAEDLHILNEFVEGDVIDVRVNSMIIYLGAGHTYWSGEWVSDSNGNL